MQRQIVFCKLLCKMLVSGIWNLCIVEKVGLFWFVLFHKINVWCYTNPDFCEMWEEWGPTVLGVFQLLHKGYLQTPINYSISMGLWCSALLDNLRAKMSLPIISMLVLSKIICHLVSYSTTPSIVLTSNCHYIPGAPQGVLWPGPLGVSAQGWGAQCDTDLSLQCSGVARAALGSSVVLRAKAGTKQGWQCMFFPWLSSPPHEHPFLLLLWADLSLGSVHIPVLLLLLCFIFSRFL